VRIVMAVHRTAGHRHTVDSFVLCEDCCEVVASLCAMIDCAVSNTSAQTTRCPNSRLPVMSRQHSLAQFPQSSCILCNVVAPTRLFIVPLHVTVVLCTRRQVHAT